jgi:hypothetical protein
MTDSESPDPLPSVDALQFRRAQPTCSTETPPPKTCASCKELISGDYYQVQNHVICPSCAVKIQAGRQSQNPIPWVRLVIYGTGAALAGSILYAIPLALGFQIGIVALVVGYMVGKAIRHGSYGVGGRPQQILAVVLTYFAISTSFFPAALITVAKHNIEAKHSAEIAPLLKPGVFTAAAIPALVVFAIISPFLELRSSPVGGLISLFILFIGLQRAWALTAGHEILVTGPYS